MGGKNNIREACAAQNVPQNDMDSCVNFVRMEVANELKKQKKCSTDSDCFVIVDRANRTAPHPKEWESQFTSNAKRFANAPIIQLHAPQIASSNELAEQPASLLVDLKAYKKNDSWSTAVKTTLLTVHDWMPGSSGAPCILLRIEREGLPTVALEVDDPLVEENDLGLFVRRATNDYIFVPIATDVNRMTLLMKRDRPVNDCFAQRDNLEVVAVLPGWKEAIEDCRRRAQSPQHDCGKELEERGKPSRVWQGVPLQRW